MTRLRCGRSSEVEREVVALEKRERYPPVTPKPRSQI